MAKQHVPQATAERLPLYYRTLQRLVANGKTRVSSSELGILVQIDSTTIRKDLSYFGALGKKGYGYDTQHLMEFLKKTLYQDELSKVILIGVGNLGTALLNHNFQKNNNTQIVAAYDIDPDKIGTKVGGTRIYAMDELRPAAHHDIMAAILAVPAAHAQEAADRALAAGIHGFLNFSPTTLSLPAYAYVRHVDMTIELQALIYFLNHAIEQRNSQ